MENNNIYEFYEGVLTGRTWDDLLLEFELNASKEGEERLYTEPGTITPYNWNQYLHVTSRFQARNLLRAIEEQMENLPTKEEKKEWLEKNLIHIEYYISKIDKDLFIRNDLREIYEDIPMKFKYIFGNPNVSEYKSLKNSGSNVPVKLQWNAGVGSLGTLLYELRYKCTNRNGQPYIEGTLDELVDFAVDIFSDKEEGKSFDKGSLRKYIDPLSSKDKAKRDKVDLTNVIKAQKEG